MKSLSFRVALSAALVLAVFMVLSAVALEKAFRDSARAARQERLLAQVYLVMAATEVDPAGKISIGSGALEPRLDMPGSGLFAAIMDDAGQFVWKSRSHLSVATPVHHRLPPGEKQFEELSAQDTPFLMQSYGIRWSTGGASYPFTFSVAEYAAPLEEQIAAYRRSLWGWLGAMGVLLIAGQWAVLRWGLRPLRQVAEEIHALQEGGKDKVEGDYPTELTLLTENLNSLLTRERAQQKRYRDALSDLAHSLKTPLALMRGASRAREADFQQTLDEQVERMDKIVGYHLQRAATSGKSAWTAPVAPRPLVQRTLAALAKVYSDKALQTEVEMDESVRFRGDEGDLMELLGNLLDNACKWCRTRVSVTARVEDKTLLLQVEDDGPGIPASQAEAILGRGVRLDQSTPGQGIGLAVSAQIVQAYDGQIHIEQSALGGACVAVTLPGSMQRH